MIDIHMHIGRLYNGKNMKPEEQALTPEYLLDFMDKAGIEKAVLLPIENPEATSYYVTTDYVLDVCKKYPDKFIPFCNVDPRRSRLYEVIKEYKDRGCKGMGEVLAGLYVDDPLMQKMYEICGKLNMPIIFDLCHITCLDDLGLPRFENMIKKFPETTFSGHGPHFWAEISADYKSREIYYPTGKVISPGAVERLLSKYSNAYADISAGSGYTALTRDEEFGYQFMEKFQDKLFFGTDICHVYQDVPNVSYFKNAGRENKISKTAYEKIAYRNTQKLLGL